MAAMVEQPDPAAVFACAMSLHDACMKRAEADASLDLSDAYQGMDQFMRELMRVADLFENWACHHVAFEQLGEVWPYLLEERFGAACLERMDAGFLSEFNEDDCFAVALRLRFPLWIDEGLPLPFLLEVGNPVSGSEFSNYRIQTFRTELESGELQPFVAGEEELDENFGVPFFAIHGMCRDGTTVPVAERGSYREAAGLLRAMFPGMELPERVVNIQHRS